MLRQVSKRGDSHASTGSLDALVALAASSSAQMDLDDLLGDLVGAVRQLLGTDTAAILLLDEGGRSLVARAASGLEEEVRQGVRVPVGTGFAGRVAAERSPVILDRVDPSSVVNPLLPAKGIRALLGVPLVAQGTLIGVLHVGTLTDRRFTAADSELLERAAASVAGAIQLRMLSVERAAAELLERSLMPSALPECDGLELAARYTPADRAVGGDWYDVFVLPSGELWVVTGDVAGHGLHGAVVMGRARSTLRSYAFLGGIPADVLARTDAKLQHFEPGAMVTVVCASGLPPYEEFRMTSAGHPVPVAAYGDETWLVDLSPEPPLGVVAGYQRTFSTVALPASGVFVFYTDGLVERRGESLDDGLGRLLAAVVPDRAEAVCARVMQRLIGHTQPTDDVAVVALRRTGGGGTK